jgi:flagellar protein FlgJ
MQSVSDISLATLNSPVTASALSRSIQNSGGNSAGPSTDPLLKASQEFEAMFLGYLLKVMRSTVDSTEGDSTSKGKEIYLDLFDNEIALNIARTRSLGVGEMMYRQLKDKEKAQQGPAVSPGNALGAGQSVDFKSLNQEDPSSQIPGKVQEESHDN